MCVVHWGLLMGLPWRAWVCPSEGQMWRSCGCLGRRGSGSTRYSGVLAAKGSRNYSALEGPGNQYWPIHSSVLAWRTPLPDREAWQATVHRVTKSRTLLKRPCMHRHKTFFAHGSSALGKVECEGGPAAWPAGAKCAGTWTASTTGVMTLSESFFEPVIAGNQKASLASLSL